MKDKLTQFKQGEVLQLTYTGISYGGYTPTTLTGLQFYATVENYESKVELIALTNTGITRDDNGGSPIVSLALDTAALSAETQYEYELIVDDPAYGIQVLDEFFLYLRPMVVTVP